MLNPGQKGWLKEYLEFRKEILSTKEESPHKKPQPRHPDESLYELIQPTGLMYGYPMHFSKYKKENAREWDKENIMKVLLAETLINSALLHKEVKLDKPEDLSEAILNTVSKIADFYNNIYPDLATSNRTFFGKKKSPLEVAEKILEKRIGFRSSSPDNFWSNFFNNSLLFLDIFFFGQWIHTSPEKTVTEFFKHEKEELRFAVIKVIVAAAHANQIIESEERKLFEYFLESSDLPHDKVEEAKDYLEEGVDVADITLPGNSWILKKYFLELAILTVWADKKVEDSEVEFLEEFGKQIGLSNEDLENSMMAIEGFVIEHWEELGQLQDKHDLRQVTEKYLERISKIIDKNENRISNEIKESRHLKHLLEKARTQELNDEEKDFMRKELISILKTIPTFVIISLPSTFLTLPILLKILPKSVYPETE